MLKRNFKLHLCLLIFLLVEYGECKYKSRPSPSRPSPSRPRPATHRPATSRPATFRPFPTHAPTFRPFPTHAPTFRPFPTHAPTFRPVPTRAPTMRPFPTHSPTARPFPTHSPTMRPMPTRAPTARPFPTHAPTFRPQEVPKITTRRTTPHVRPPTTTKRYTTKLPMTTYPTSVTKKISTIKNEKIYMTTMPTRRTTKTTQRARTKYPLTTLPRRTTRYYETTIPNRRTTHYHITTPRPHKTTTRYVPYPQGPYPTRPGYQTPPPIFRPSGLGGQINQPIYQRPLAIPAPGGKTKIKVYNVNNYHHPGYYAPPSYPVYRYGSSDVGSGALGFFLGYSLAKVTQPTYYRYHGGASYDGYTPRFDHYTIHHYHNNPQAIPPRQTLSANTIETCGDSAQICPAGTSALCTAKGEIMCVVNALSTVACKDDANRRCVKTTIPCENDQAPECKGIPKGSTTSIDIPCISNAELSGNVTTVNNTIVSLEKKNSTLVTTTQLPITTLPTSNTVPSLGYLRAKRQAPVQNYCVTIVAEPAVREPTEGEKVFNEVSSVFENLFSKAFNTR